MRKLYRNNTGISTNLPIKIIQFGEGKFLGAFVEYSFQILNNEVGFNVGISVVQAIEKAMVS